MFLIEVQLAAGLLRMHFARIWELHNSIQHEETFQPEIALWPSSIVDIKHPPAPKEFQINFSPRQRRISKTGLFHSLL